MANGNEYLDLQIFERKRYGLLSEVLSLSGQMAEALDRGDETSVRILMSMRQAPIAGLVEMKQSEQLLSEQASARGCALLGGASAGKPEEEALARQVASNGKLLEQILSLDARLNRKIAGDKSFYTNSEAEGKTSPGSRE